MKKIEVKCRGCMKSVSIYGRKTKGQLFKLVDPNQLPNHSCNND